MVMAVLLTGLLDFVVFSEMNVHTLISLTILPDLQSGINCTSRNVHCTFCNFQDQGKRLTRYFIFFQDEHD